MSDDHWNDDVAYIFSMQRTVMQVFGIWPLQKNTVFRMLRWGLSTFLQCASCIFLFMEFTDRNRNAGASIEAILFLTCIICSILKHLCVTWNRDKLARNINAVIDDWFLARNNEETYKIMKKYAITSRLPTSFIVYSTYVCTAIYMFAVILMNVRQMFLKGTNVSNGTFNWIFLIPSGPLSSKINNLEYTILIFLQNVQILLTCVTQCIVDSLYISIILHLTGQLEVLKTRFKAFANESDTETNHRKQLIGLINRHCKLTEFNQNLEDTFHLIILFQLLIVTILLALIGLRVILCLENKDYVELVKSILTLNFVFMEAIIYSYGGDFVQSGSEDVSYAMFTASWCTLPVALMKDLHFAMMRSSYPFHLTGGKFFYANRETMLSIFKTAASYISVLRVAMKES